jgi:hypothetical protein
LELASEIGHAPWLTLLLFCCTREKVSPARECPYCGNAASVFSVAGNTSLGAQLEVNLKIIWYGISDKQPQLPNT